MNHSGTVILETERLLLRPFSEADAEAVFRNWTSDDEVTRYLTWPTHRSVEDTRGFMRFCVDSYADPACYQWAIVLRPGDEPIGSIAVVACDESVSALELGWVLGRRWWGQGLMPEAAEAVMRHLFTVVGANRVCARYDVENAKSGRVMEKLGMTREGLLRQSGRNNRGIVDCVLYSMLCSEYLLRRARES